jgi:hypothetical protein
MTNQYVKYEDFVINSFQDNQWKPCGLQTAKLIDQPTLAMTLKAPVTLTFDLVTPKSIGVIN